MRLLFTSSRAICALQKKKVSQNEEEPSKEETEIKLKMDAGGSGAIGSEIDREEEEAENEILRDRFRLCTISIAEAEGLICYSKYPYEFFKFSIRCLLLYSILKISSIF